MSARRLIIAAAILGHSVVALGSNVDGISISHFEPLERINVSAKGVAYTRKPGDVRPVELSFDALGRTFDLELEPNARLLGALPASADRNKVMPYRGRLKGVADSWVRIVMTGDQPAGVIWDGQDLYAIELPGDSVVASTAPVIYRLGDVVIAPGTLSCASGPATTNGAEVFKSVVGNLAVAMARAEGAVAEITVSTLADSLFTTNRGANAQSNIVNRMNLVDGYFSEQLGVQINADIELFTGTDPFDPTTDARTLLFDVAEYRQTTPGQMDYALTHLWTGRTLDGPTVGIAFTGALCLSVGAAVSEGNAGATFDSLIAAHEIGHNFGAPHDGDPDEACADAPAGFLMAPMLTSSSDFSACSIAVMQQQIQFVGPTCVTPLPSTDISVEYNDAPPTILLSNAANVAFDVVNRGTEPALNVNANVTLPANVALIAASSSIGTCTSGSGMVSCAIGDIAGGSAATVTISADTTAVGADTFSASVTATADDNGSNNQVSTVLTVDPAVNLAATQPSQATIDLNQATSVSVSLANQAVLDATGVTLTVTMGPGLRADSASWALGTCTVAASQIDCVATQFDSQSDSSISIGLTGTSAGTSAYSVELASTEADADPVDNIVNATVRVRDPADDDDGGGSMGWLFLALLALASCRRYVSGSRRTS